MSQNKNRFMNWLNGENDTFSDSMEMKPQKEYEEEESSRSMTAYMTSTEIRN